MARTRTKSARRRRVIQIQPGAAPGTVRVDPEAPRSELHVMAYGPEKCVEETVSDLGRLEELGRGASVVWVNVDGIRDRATIVALGRMYGLHPLAVEDLVNLGQRAKVESYDDHLFIMLNMPTSGEGFTEQVGLFVGRNFVLTFQVRPGDCFDPVRERIRVGKGRIRKSGPDYLAYALIDATVDAFFPVLEGLGERLEELEDSVLRAPDDSIPEKVQTIRHELREIGRDHLPHRDVLTALLRPDTPFVSDTTRVYLRDCWDHAVRVSETVDSYREESSDLMHAHLSSLSNRMNEVMKVLTIMAAIFIPLSFIAGVYGMNFDPQASPWNMPELGWAFGYPAALLLMAAVAGGLLLFFRRKGWF